eukprot:scpid84221/ scgid24874/ Profilin
MSWTSYCDTLVATGQVKSAGIYGLDGSPWAQSEGLTLTTSEVATLLKGKTDSSILREHGVKFQGQKFFFLRESGDGNSYYFKKGNAGGIFAKTNTCCVLGLYVEGQQPGPCNVQTEKNC